jgi:cAMP-dependent protein kinase regulator
LVRYGTPRAASVKCVTDTIVWAIDRLTFRKIIMGRTVEKRTVYSQFLKNVKILASLNDYETQTLADALQPKNFNKGDQIVKQGEEGFSFFIITGGEALAWKYLDGKRVDLIKLTKGDYFGELALLFNEPRAATVEAVTPLKTVCLNGKSFKSLLGPLEDILKRNTTNYDHYMNEKLKNKK